MVNSVGACTTESQPHYEDISLKHFSEDALILCGNNKSSAIPRHIFMPLNWYGCPKNEPKFLRTSSIFLNFNQFHNCTFFLPNFFMTPFSRLVSKSS